MRKRIIASVVVLIGLFILAALNVNFLVARNKDYLLGRLAQTLGHAVTADKIEISYQPFAVGLVNVAIAGDPADAASPLVHAKDIQIKLRVLPLLLGQFQPDKIILDGPMITIVRDADGRFNYESQARNKPSGQERTSRSDKVSNDRQIFAIAALQVSHGTLRYRDVKNDGEIIVAQIELTVSDFDQDEPIEIQLAAAVMTAKPNLKFNSRIGPIAGIRDYRDYPIVGGLDAERLDLGKVNRALPQFRKALPKHLRFDGIYDIKELRFKGTLNKLSLKGAVSGTDASFRFE